MYFFSSEQEIRGKRQKPQLEGIKLAITMEKRILDRDVPFLGHRNWLLSIYLITLGFFLNVILSVNCLRGHSIAK